MSVLVRVATGAALVAAIAATSLTAPADAGALTRSQVMKRAKVWVDRKVPYSQSGRYQGYRRDCSGFVSMAWKLNSSYTTRSLSSKGKRVAISSLKVGDAVLIPGRHVSIFGGWKNKAKRQYWAYEETTWGSHAKKRVRSIPSNAHALRYKGITVAKAKPKPKPAPAPTVVTSPADALPGPEVAPEMRTWVAPRAVSATLIP